MASTRGIDPFPRSYDESIPRAHIPYLEDIRRASNAVRVLRRRGRPSSSAEYRAAQATKAYREFLDREQRAIDKPRLF